MASRLFRKKERSLKRFTRTKKSSFVQALSNRRRFFNFQELARRMNFETLALRASLTVKIPAQTFKII